MCGIVGIVNYGTGEPVSPSLLKRMCQTIVHRGPDDEGILVDGPVGLGMRRLAIIDVAGGHQPLANEDGTVHVVFNGEIYNHKALQDELEGRGHRFRTRSDTECLVHAWEEFGPDCVQHLRGMFAFVIWDRRSRELFAARDHLGVKPFFYSDDGERLVWGSEIKALRASGLVETHLDWQGLDAYFAYNYIPAPLTVYTGISKLPPGHYLHLRDGRLTRRRYWDLSFDDKMTAPEEDLLEELEERLREAVSLRLESEVPLGAFLSGGIDSGLVVAMMSGLSDDPVRTFTVGFSGETGDYLDERPYARELSQRYGTLHHEERVVPTIDEAVVAGMRAFDEPFADDSVIPTYHICRQASRSVTVVLTGLGGDENFAGYERYLGFRLSGLLDLVPGLVCRRVLQPVVMSLRERPGGSNRINHLKRFVAACDQPPDRRWQSYVTSIPAAVRQSLYAPGLRAHVDTAATGELGREHFQRLEGGDLLDRALYQDIMTYVPEDILALSDRLGMAHSLELRVPLMDHRLVEFCARIPSRLKIRWFRKKYLLTRLARRYLPTSIFAHRKQGFAAPMASWLRNELSAQVRSLLDWELVGDDGLFDRTFVARLIEEHLERRQLNDKVLYALLAFREWHRLESR